MDSIPPTNLVEDTIILVSPLGTSFDFLMQPLGLRWTMDRRQVATSIPCAVTDFSNHASRASSLCITISSAVLRSKSNSTRSRMIIRYLDYLLGLGLARPSALPPESSITSGLRSQP